MSTVNKEVMKKIQGKNRDCNTLVMFKIMSNKLTRLICMHANFQEYALAKDKGQTLALFKFKFRPPRQQVFSRVVLYFS